MAVLAGDLINRDNVADDGTLNLDFSAGIDAVQFDGQTFVYVAGRDDNGLTGFEVDANGILTTVPGAVVNNGPGIPLAQPEQVIHATVGGTNFLYAGTNDDGITSFEIQGDGSLDFIENVPDDATLEIDFIRGRMAVATVDGTTFLLASGFADDGVSVFAIEGDGELDNTDNVLDNAALALDGAYDIGTIEVDGTTFAAVAGFFDDGVSVFELAGDGTLSATDTVFDGGVLELDGAVGVATATVDGTGFVFVGGFTDDGISVFEIDGNGQLSNVFNIADGGDAALSGVVGLTAFTAGGQHFLAASAEGDDALSYFAIGADGSLDLIDTVLDGDLAELELNGSFYSAFAEIDGDPFLFATGFADDGVSSFAVGGDDDLLTGTADGDVLLGFEGDDTLIGVGGNDTIKGGVGADNAIGGSGDDLIEGDFGRRRAGRRERQRFDHR